MVTYYYKQIYEALEYVKADYSTSIVSAKGKQRVRLETCVHICDIFSEDIDRSKPAINGDKIPINVTEKELVDMLKVSADTLRNYINGIAVKTREKLGVHERLKYQLIG